MPACLCWLYGCLWNDHGRCVDDIDVNLNVTDAYATGVQMPVITAEQPRAVQDRMPRVAACSMAGVAVVYMLTGMLGYVAYPCKTPGNILTAFEASVAVDIVKAIMAIHVALAFPVMLFPSRAGRLYRPRLVCVCQRESSQR